MYEEMADKEQDCAPGNKNVNGDIIRSEQDSDCTRPDVSKECAIRLASALFGISILEKCKVEEMESFVDRNFYLQGVCEEKLLENDATLNMATRSIISTVESPREYVLKVLNSVDSKEIGYVEAQNSAMLLLQEHGFKCSVPFKSKAGLYIEMCSLGYFGHQTLDVSAREKGAHACPMHAVRLLDFVPGKLLGCIKMTDDLLFELGQYVASVDKVLQSFTHSSLEERDNKWDLQCFPLIEKYLDVLSNRGHKELIHQIYSGFTSEVLPCLKTLEKQTIHNDLNEANVVVAEKADKSEYCITGIIDFGDMAFSYRLFEVATVMAYAVLLMYQSNNPRPIHMAGHVLAGYQSVFPLSSLEMDCLQLSVAARILQSVVMETHQKNLEPDNEYLLKTVDGSLDVLCDYMRTPREGWVKHWLSIQ